MFETFPIFIALGVGAFSGSHLASGVWKARLHVISGFLLLIGYSLFMLEIASGG